MIAATLLGSVTLLIAILLSGVRLQSYSRAAYDYSIFSVGNIVTTVVCVLLALAAVLWPVAAYTEQELANGFIFDANSVVFLVASGAVLVFVLARVTSRTSLAVGLYGTLLLVALAMAIVAAVACACAMRESARARARERERSARGGRS